MGPSQWPDWTQAPRAAADAVVAEIVANLLENAFRYSPAGCELGLTLLDHGICIWDAGPAIPGRRTRTNFRARGEGQQQHQIDRDRLGLALARQLAENLGGSLTLETTPNTLHPTLPALGNAFVLRLPRSSQAATPP